MIDAFEDFRVEPRELLDFGDKLVLTIQYGGHGSGSGVPVNIPLFQLFCFMRGLVVWQKDFKDRSEALEAAGLSEQVMSQENVEIVRGVRYRISLPSERASQRRTLDERLFVRFPALYRWFAERVLQLPLRSRLRRLMLSRIARRVAAAGNRRDFDVLLYGFDPAIELELPESQVGGYLPPDLPSVHRGRDGYRRMWESLIEAWPDLTVEPEEVIDCGNKLLSAVRLRAHGRHSGIALDQLIFQLFTLSRGLVVRQKDFAERKHALEAAGLRE
jgi:ketosteroid isomerase-like protein